MILQNARRVNKMYVKLLILIQFKKDKRIKKKDHPQEFNIKCLVSLLTLQDFQLILKRLRKEKTHM